MGKVRGQGKTPCLVADDLIATAADAERAGELIATKGWSARFALEQAMTEKRRAMCLPHLEPTSIEGWNRGILRG